MCSVTVVFNVYTVIKNNIGKNVLCCTVDDVSPPVVVVVIVVAVVVVVVVASAASASVCVCICSSTVVVVAAFIIVFLYLAPVSINCYQNLL